MTRAVTAGDALPSTIVVIENWLDEVRAMLRP
jgi:hypothetical protein